MATHSTSISRGLYLFGLFCRDRFEGKCVGVCWSVLCFVAGSTQADVIGKNMKHGKHELTNLI